jgi:NAD(P)-dependent dehydrogenase (short-subunit alcohol dehydrogenase family)
MILVTGATGTIGRELVPQLLEAGEQVRVFVRDKHKVAEKRVEIALGDLRPPRTLEQALQAWTRCSWSCWTWEPGRTKMSLNHRPQRKSATEASVSFVRL